MTPGVSKVRIGSRWIGDGQPCCIIAEAGSNHNGSLQQAKRLIDVAASAKADAVKFQLFRADTLYPKGAGQSDYLKDPRSIYDIIAEMQMPYEWLPELSAYCREKDILFLASVFDEEAADRLHPYVVAFKIASYEMTHIPLVRHVAKKGKPVIISTGAANLQEVSETVEEFRRAGNGDLILMHCTAAYPAPLESLNLRAVLSMKAAFGVPVGLSDHSRDPVVGPLSAVALGADLIEKHFTLSNALPGPDHSFALEPHELHQMVQKIREVERALGSGEKKVQAVEAELRKFARRSIFAVRQLISGEVLTRENIAVLRCGNLDGGVKPERFDELLGRRVRRAIAAESALQEGDVA